MHDAIGGSLLRRRFFGEPEIHPFLVFRVSVLARDLAQPKALVKALAKALLKALLMPNF
jgi:hypothetical protein